VISSGKLYLKELRTKLGGAGKRRTLQSMPLNKRKEMLNVVGILFPNN